MKATESPCLSAFLLRFKLRLPLLEQMLTMPQATLLLLLCRILVPSRLLLLIYLGEMFLRTQL